MFIELIDRLCCPNAHEHTWLVAAMDDVRDRDILRGTLGCPVCQAEFPIVDGVVRFADVTLPPSSAPDPGEAMRLAAALELTDARMVAVLHGRWASHAALVRSMMPARLILVNAPADVAHDAASSIVYAATCPVAPARADAVALDDIGPGAMLESLVRALRPGGRMLAPISVDVPEDVDELTRDDEIWVGRRMGAAPRLMNLSRRPAPAP